MINISETNSNEISLDWYKDYNITVIPSMKSGEAYSIVDSFKIDKDWDRTKQTPDNYKIIYHKTFAFQILQWLYKKPIKRIIKDCLINIEKLYLLRKLGVRDIFSVEQFIKPEGTKTPFVTLELIEDIAGMEINDAQFRDALSNKKIYYFQRIKWTIDGERVRARFNFLILDN